MDIPRHKVFISYYHTDDQKFKNELLFINAQYGGNLFVDWSVREGEVDDTGKTSERVRQIIRDEYIQDATVLLLLCGARTMERKHVDWEIHAAMFNTDKNPQMGILVVNLPTISQFCHASGNFEKELVAPNCSWISYETRKEYENAYPYMPIRIIDNFTAGIKDNTIIPISVVNWNRIQSNPLIFKQLINNAFERGQNEELHYDHSRLLKGRNS